MQLFKNPTILIFIFILFQAWISGCINNAERDNPLDPKSNNYQHKGIIRGKIYTYYPPYRPLASAEILVTPGHYWTISNQNGEFTISNLPENEYSIYVSLSGYTPDSVKINLKPGSNENLQFYLNAGPQFVNYTISSGHISRWWPYDLYLIKANVEVADSDGLADVSLVRLNLPAFDFTDSLNRTANPAIFSGIFYREQFSVTNLHRVLGHPFYLQVQDSPGAICESLPIYIARIIENEETPIPISPQGLESVAPQPILVWQKLILPYSFSYKIEVTRVDEEFRTLVWSVEEVDSDSTSIRVAEPLTSATYFWTVSAVDEFGNWSRSKEAPFRVE